jgi:T-complex protein 1 subunit zeta
MSAIQTVNPRAMVMRKKQALMVNVNAAKGLQEVLHSNLGPKGTLKMLVGGAGQIKITKDGRTLLGEMQIQHPTACMIGRTATAQDDSCGDGTTSVVLFAGELLSQAQRFIDEGLHPRIIADGFEKAREHVAEFLDDFKTSFDTGAGAEAVDDGAAGGGGGGGAAVGDSEAVVRLPPRDMLMAVARTALRTKLQPELADQLTQICTDAVLTIAVPGQPIDLHMIETMHMIHRSATETKLVKGLVMDHGVRHPDMPTHLENCYIMTCNVSMEYEKTEINSGFYYNSAEQREKMVSAERVFTDEKVAKILELKRKVCTKENGKNFVIVSQKGIDPVSLDALCKEGVMALRRAKRRNMERLTLACGGSPVNSVEDLDESVLGWAGKVYEQSLGDDKWTFVEDVQNPKSVTILMKGPNPHTIAQIKDAVKDGTRCVKNAIDDGGVVAGAGAFEIAAAESLRKFELQVSGKEKLGVRAFAQALLVIPKTLAKNSGLDILETMLAAQEEHQKTGKAVGIDVETGDPMLPAESGIWDNVNVKRQFISLSTIMASQLLLVDEVMRAGRNMKRSGPDGNPEQGDGGD